MNWIKVTYDGLRTVYVDGEPLGDTNEVLYLGESGTYTFDLGDPRDYQPAKAVLQVEGTTRKTPLIIQFT